MQHHYPRITVLCALLASSGVAGAQSRSSTVFASPSTGTLAIRAAVVLPDYTVKPLPLLVVSARRNGGADVISGRTDLEGRLSMTLPPGRYTLEARPSERIGGRAFAWAVPVAVKASSSQVLELTNANASVDSSVVATAPPPATTARPMKEANAAAIDHPGGASSGNTIERDRGRAPQPTTPPTGSVAEPPPAAPRFVNGNVLRSTPVRANTSGLFLGLDLNASSIRFDNESSSIESGGGISAQIGWGFTENVALLFDVSGAAISSDGGDYGLGQFEIAGRWHFASSSRALVPFLEVGYVGRAVVQNDVVYYDDFGDSYTGDFSLLGAGVGFGGGLQYHVAPTLALGGSLKWTVGHFSTVKIDNVSIDGINVSATSARLNLGFTWYPVAGDHR